MRKAALESAVAGEERRPCGEISWVLGKEIVKVAVVSSLGGGRASEPEKELGESGPMAPLVPVHCLFGPTRSTGREEVSWAISRRLSARLPCQFRRPCNQSWKT